jgi:pyruvate formate lyase activating enzyme
MSTGRIFDIRRFSTHDGVGLRTNIFFKGCPLRCVWCQNPEGLESFARPVWFQNKCIGCGTCIRLARCGGVQAEPKGIILDRSRAEDWEKLIEECPTGALMMDCREYTVEQLVHEVEKDRVFYRAGGGVTISGGEPLLQGDIVAELLETLQKKGFHTAIETSLFAPLETVQKVMSHVSQIYADMMPT